MNRPRARLAVLVSAGLLVLPAAAQYTSTPSTPGVDGALPWYVGAGQGFFHDTNVYRIPNGPADTYSSTTLFGGFDQPISRQRVHGNAAVSLNRYLDEKQLDNTSYDFSLGLIWETAGSLSGSFDGGMRQHLAYLSVNPSTTSDATNLGKTKWLDARARWGGTSLFSVEGSARWSDVAYSDESYASRESTGTSGALSVHYGRGGPLRLGIGGRYTRTKTPKAGFDPIVPEFLPNTATGRHIDFFANYDVTGQIRADLRLSYTDQENTLVEASDFKGWTGRLAASWQATGKLQVNALASRDTGFDSQFSSVTFVPPGSPPGTPPVTRLYDNNRLTYALDLGAVYAATAKIDVAVGAHYTRSELVSTAEDVLAPIESTDRQKLLYIGANYAFLRNGVASCRLARDLRDVSGGSNSYNSTLLGCHVRLLYRN